MPFDLTILLASAAILFATHALGGIVAFGSSLLALPLFLWAGWDLRPAVAVLVLVGTVQAAQMVWLAGRGADRRALGTILLWALPGVPLGFVLAGLLPERGLQIALGALLAAAGASRLAEHASGKRWSPPGWALKGLLLAGGMIHAAFGSGGTTLTVYARYALVAKASFRGTLPLMWIALNALVLGGLAVEGQIDLPVLTAAGAGTPAVLLATLVGHRAAERLSQERFADVVAALLCLAGAITIVRNAF